MRPVDADIIDAQIRAWIGQPGYGDYWTGYDNALCAIQDFIADIPTLTPQNEALTIEQLREMDGEPVWVDFTGSAIKREPGWFILKNAQDEEVYLVGKTSVYKGYEYYGKTWLAYRRPPERQEDT